MGQKRVGVSRTPRYLKVETRSMGDPAKNEGTKLGSWEGLWENNMYFSTYTWRETSEVVLRLARKSSR